METRMGFVILIILFVLFNNCSISFVNSASSSSLSVKFYDESCPRVEQIIHEELVKKMSPFPLSITIPATLRLFFHDCYVQGCDGSVLITSTADNIAERDAPINLPLAGDAFDMVEKAKAALEKECPGIVSCSDTLAILARDVVNWWQGPYWEVEKGRRDGFISNATEAQLLIPKSYENITSLIRGFQSIGLSTADLVTLSGAHTIGSTHCIEFADRILQNDTSMNSTLRQRVTGSCRFPEIDRNVCVALDQDTEFVFDNKFFKSLLQGKGLLSTDHALAFGENDLSRKLVYKYANDQDLFFREFAKSMIKLGRIGVKTGNQGEVRRVCTKITPALAPVPEGRNMAPGPDPHPDHYIYVPVPYPVPIPYPVPVPYPVPAPVPTKHSWDLKTCIGAGIVGLGLLVGGGIVAWLLWNHFHPPLPPPRPQPQLQLTPPPPLVVEEGEAPGVHASLERWLQDAAEAPPPSSTGMASHGASSEDGRDSTSSSDSGYF